MNHVLTLIHTRVPIVKFSDPTNTLYCDISVNNKLALYNSQLLADYSRIDSRAHQLGLIIKYWAKRRQINEPFCGTLSSYGYILMVIHFLQQREPPILPCLQQIYNPEKPYIPFIVDSFDCYYYDKIDKLINFGNHNKETLGQLLASFFQFYATKFDWDNWVISIRTGKFLTKTEKDWTKKIEKNNSSKSNFYLTIEVNKLLNFIFFKYLNRILLK